jgi:hypothetical protein
MRMRITVTTFELGFHHPTKFEFRKSIVLAILIAGFYVFVGSRVQSYPFYPIQLMCFLPCDSLMRVNIRLESSVGRCHQLSQFYNLLIQKILSLIRNMHLYTCINMHSHAFTCIHMHSSVFTCTKV